MSSELPIVFLAFANQLDDHLATLKDESRNIFRALQALEKDNKIVIHREESSEFDELYQDLLTYGDRMVIFHYGGHADGASLELEDGSGGAGGIAGLLGQQSSLKLVFLNGCATRDQVKLLHAAGVPAVIATAVEINDARATHFSTAFYEALAEGRSIFEAFESACRFVEGKFGIGGRDGVSISRRPKHFFKEEEAEPAVFEWALYTQEHATGDLEQWRLPEAREEWRVQLEDTRGPLRDPDGNPLLIEHRSRFRTVEAICCLVCGTASTVTGEQETTCPVCGSDQVELEPVPTEIANHILPFLVTEEEARARVMAQAGVDQSREIRLNRLFVPHWVFDVDTRTVLEAETGWNRDPTAVPPKLEWEPVKDEIALSFDAYLVPAGSVPLQGESISGEWYWELDRVAELDQIDPQVACVPLDQSIQSAFQQVASNLARELEAEAADRVGGHQQRNITTDTRYRKVSARTFLLPHWFAAADLEQGKATFLVNGQTGALRSLPLPDNDYLKQGIPKTMTNRTFEPNEERPGTSLAASVFAGVGIGLMVGLMLGLAAPSADAKPVVGIFIGAVGAALAVLLGLNDRHFSTAKALRIGAFGLAAVIAAPTGIVIRTHKLLEPETPVVTLADKKKEYENLGFKGPRLLNLLGQEIGERSRIRESEAVNKLPEGLHSTQTSKKTCDYFVARTEWETDDFQLQDVRNSIWQFIDDGNEAMTAEENKWAPLLNAVQDDLTGDSRKKLLLIARDVGCDDPDSQTPAIRLSDDQCQKFKGANEPSGTGLEDVLLPGDKKRVLDRVQKDISASELDDALRLLGEFLCR